MIIADQLRQKNLTEYLLYMWQVEDILRAYGCDAERLTKEYLSRFQLDDDSRRKTERWYADLCEMMRTEGKTEHAHLQINLNTQQKLTELHSRLLRSPHFPYYREMYYKVLPYIVELRARHADHEAGELQVCLEMLYGLLLLRLQKKEISPETERSAKDISTLLGQLSDYYRKDQEAPLEL